MSTILRCGDHNRECGKVPRVTAVEEGFKAGMIPMPTC